MKHTGMTLKEFNSLGPRVFENGAVQDEIIRALEDRARLRAIVGAIDELRDTEGSSVLVSCDNPDDMSNGSGCYVEVVAGWSKYEVWQFGGTTLIAALAAAVDAKRAAQAER